MLRDCMLPSPRPETLLAGALSDMASRRVYWVVHASHAGPVEEVHSYV